MMSLPPEMRQRLLELVYDLLGEDEAAELRQRIDGDAELAQAYAEAQSTAGLLAEAAKVRVPKIELKRPGTSSGAHPGVSRAKPPAKPGRPAATPWARGATWAVGLAAAVLLMVSVGGYFYHREQLADIATEHLRLVVTGPAKLHSGTQNEYTVTTTAVSGAAIRAQVEFALYSPGGEQLRLHKETTDEQGRLRIAVPADLEVPSGSRLEVLAVHRDSRQRVDTRLEVEPVRHATQLSLDKPLYRPGETIYYRSLTLSRFGLTDDREMPIHFEILDPGGAAVADSQLQGATRRGVGSGAFTIPAGLVGGEYTLVARSPRKTFPEQRRTFLISRYRLPRLKKELEFARDSYAPGDTVVADFSAERAEGGPAAEARLTVIATVDGQRVHSASAKASADGAFQVEFTLPKKIERGDGQLVVVADDGGTRETIAKTIPINLGKVVVDFYPEGGELVANLENRVYFAARDPLGDPVELRGKIVDGQDNNIVVGVKTMHEGMGSFSFTPRAGERYRLKIIRPADVANDPKLPEVSSKQQIVLRAGIGVFDAGQPLEFNVRSAKEGLPLVAAAWCRGAPVGQQWFTTTAGEDSESGANSVKIPLTDGAGGVIRLTIYDYSSAPPVPVAERLVYRRPDRRLKVRVADHGEKYSPGEKVSMSLIVSDEDGRPVPAVLGVSVVDDALLNLADSELGKGDTPAMPTYFLLTSEVDKPEDLEDADFYLSDDAEADVALDLLLGTQGWRRFVEKTLQQLKEEGEEDERISRLVALGGEANPPAMFDNLAQIRAKYEESIETYRAQRTRLLNTLTTVSFFGGLGLLVLVAMMVLLNIATGIRLWLPAFGAAVACLVIGAVLMNPERLRSGEDVAVAFAQFDMAPPPVAQTGAAGEAKSDLAMKAGEVLDEPRMAQQVEMEEDGLAADQEGIANGALMAMPKAAAMAPAEKPMGMGMAAAERDEGVPGRGYLADREFRWAGGKDLDRLARRRGQMLAGRGVLKEEAARKGGRFFGKGKQRSGRPEDNLLIVRQYAHRHVPGEPGVRSDFAETLFWHPLLVADADGRAEIQFDLCDSVTTFRVTADAHGPGGRIGSGSGEVISRIPFNLEPKLPLEVTRGDRVDLPLAVVNDTDDRLDVALSLEAGDLLRLDGKPQRDLKLKADGRTRQYFALDVVGDKGRCDLTFRGIAGQLADAVKRSLVVVPPGFPKDLSYSGQIDDEQEVLVKLPESWVRGSLEVTVNVFPSTLADLQEGLEGILREPCGCFEQASTSNYPNVLTLQYMEENDVADPAVTRRARELLKQGYAKLAGYECPKKGYEWFGGDPGHEALTAYGLMEFRDMARVYDVERKMIERTAEWLLQRRDGRGGFKRNAKALDSFGSAPPEITDAYITWALCESGQEDIDVEVKHVIQLADKSDDPYLVALAAGSAAGSAKKPQAKKLLDKLSELQADDGHLESTGGSITRSGGHSLKVETTALAALAWLKLPAYAEQANRAVKWITASRQGSGGFGSTQATILALKALVQHAKANKRTLHAGKLIVKRDDAVIGEQEFAAGRRETLTLDGLETNLESGENKLTITLTGDNKMPYALNVSYRSEKPAGDDACPVRLSTKLGKKKVTDGQTVPLVAELTNTTDKGQPMTVAIVGLPAGLEVRTEQFDELKKAGTIDYYETRAREVICYWRSLAPKKKVKIKLDLIAAVPGKYTGPASRAYLYYTAEQKQWADPLRVEITRD